MKTKYMYKKCDLSYSVSVLFLSVLIYIAMKLNMFYICLCVTLYMHVK